MAEQRDFERDWLKQFSHSLDKVAGEPVRRRVMLGSQSLSSASSRSEIIAWTKAAMERVDELLDEQQRREVMTACACQYPGAELLDARRAYADSGDIQAAQRVLQERFESFLRITLRLEDTMVAEIARRGWGPAGVMEGGRIVATKIPKSGNLRTYMQESDPAKKRQLYCHCPRVREAVTAGEAISETYCYCGAGFYRGIWEEILQKPVEVEVLESVLQGGDICRVAVYI